MSTTQGRGATQSTNQPTTSTRGGASAQPTPANNVGGGSGWGDSGFLKGGSSRDSSGSSDESRTGKLSNDFASIREQKSTGEQKFQKDFAEAGGGVPATEDRSFMMGKPGGSDTLPGWKQAKGAINSLMGNE